MEIPIDTIDIPFEFKPSGFFGYTNIPMYETKCRGCNKVIRIKNKERPYCLDCKPFPIEV